MELTITSPYLIVDFKVQLSTSMKTNANEYFPIVKNEITNRKREITRKGEGGDIT
jgi:hypothetical protein